MSESESNRRPFRLAYLVTHPIQYQAPLLRLIAADPDIELKVFFATGGPGSELWDSGFQRPVDWDVPVLDGYDHEFLPELDRLLPRRWTQKRPVWGLWHPINYGLFGRLRKGKFDAFWVHGYARAQHWAAMIDAALLGLPVIMRDDATGIRPPRNKAFGLIKKLVFRMAGGLCDAVLPICTPASAYYRDLGIPDRKIFMMPYVVDNDYFQSLADAADTDALRKSLNLESGRPVVMYAAKFIPHKRPLDLVNAFNALQNRELPVRPYLLMVGDGELRPEVEAAAAEAGDDSVRLLGFKNQSELPELYSLADVMVLPTENEDFGVVVNEAMNARCAIIVSDTVNSGPDLVEEGRNGRIYPTGDVPALTDALTDVLSDPAKCKAMGEESRKIIDGWGLPEDVAVIKQVLNEVVKR